MAQRTHAARWYCLAHIRKAGTVKISNRFFSNANFYMPVTNQKALYKMLYGAHIIKSPVLVTAVV
jgi:hypothetical protein